MLSVAWELNLYVLFMLQTVQREGRQRSSLHHSNLLLVGVHVFQFNELQLEPRPSPGVVSNFILAFGVLGSWASGFLSMKVPRQLLCWDRRLKLLPAYPCISSRLKRTRRRLPLYGYVHYWSLVKLTDISEQPAAVSILTVVVIHPDYGEISSIWRTHISQGS